MVRRYLLLPTLAALAVSAAGCRSDDPGGGPLDGPVDPDAGVDGPVAGDPPETTITSGPSGDVGGGTTLTYQFTSDTGTAFECRVDTGTYARCTSPHTITALPGQHTFVVRARDAAGVVDPTPAMRSYNGTGAVRVRIVAGNITSGNNQAYEDPGTRIFQGLDPDIALIQEFNVDNNAPATIRAWVDTAFGPSFEMYRETGKAIPNGIVSRYPILASGFWEDPEAPDREFAYARIDLPGAIDLWAVSVHLLTTNSRRPPEATALVGFINANVPPGDYLVIGGDFNSDSRTETAITTLGQVVNVAAPYPADQAGVQGTNSSRAAPYDWVMLDADLNARQVPVVIGANSFASGLVFDSRVYTPLTDVTPVLQTDSAAAMMQHMAVVKDILLPSP